jgi:hypothetical protein
VVRVVGALAAHHVPADETIIVCLEFVSSYFFMASATGCAILG